MTKRKVDEDDKELIQALAILISNTRSNRRPLSLTEISQWLDVALKKLGGYSAVADRLGLSTKMLRQFSYVKRLAPGVRPLVDSRKLDSVDAVTHLAMLSPKEQEYIAKALSAGEIESADIRPVVQLRRTHHRGSIQELLKRAKETKKKREFVAEFVARGSVSRAKIMKAFEKRIPSKEIIRFELKGSIGRLVLTESGKNELQKTARRLGVSINQVIPTILEG